MDYTDIACRRKAAPSQNISSTKAPRLQRSGSANGSAGERRKKTYDPLRASPYQPWRVFGGEKRKLSTRQSSARLKDWSRGEEKGDCGIRLDASASLGETGKGIISTSFTENVQGRGKR